MQEDHPFCLSAAFYTISLPNNLVLAISQGNGYLGSNLTPFLPQQHADFLTQANKIRHVCHSHKHWSQSTSVKKTTVNGGIFPAKSAMWQIPKNGGFFFYEFSKRQYLNSRVGNCCVDSDCFFDNRDLSYSTHASFD